MTYLLENKRAVSDYIASRNMNMHARMSNQIEIILLDQGFNLAYFLCDKRDSVISWVL